MTPHPVEVAPIERTPYDSGEASPAPLAERLRAIADRVRADHPAFASACDAFIARLQAAEAGMTAPAVGDTLPDFLLSDDEGRLVSLAALRRKGPVVVAFLRGPWCPYCRTTAASLGEIAISVAHLGASIVAIAPEGRRQSRALAHAGPTRVPVLTDMDNGYALTLGLAIWVDEEMGRLIRDFGTDIPSAEERDSWLIPIPAAFVIDRRGRVAARFVEADYRLRMDPEAILAAIDLAGRA